MDNTRGKVIVIAGPTASGKTALSVKLAKKINAEIISSDAVQVYKKMDIGSAKVTEAEANGIKHYMIDEIYPDEEMNVSKFQKKAVGYINKILESGKNVIITGGSPLYTDAIIYSSYEFKDEEKDEKYREELNKLLDEKSNKYLHDMLKDIDPESAGKIHENNVKRVIRALEIYHLTGKKMSETAQKKRNYRYNDTLYFAIDYDREKLYKRINMRVDLMVEAGLVAEVKGLLDEGFSKELQSMQAIGYKEIVSYLNGDMTFEEAIYTIKRDTRHFAKRQLTWLRRNEDIVWIDTNKYKNADEMTNFILSNFKR